MISRAESDRRSRQLGVAREHVLRDYLLCHILNAVAANGSEDLVFRGGTALARIYWPDFRLSEDLDFVATNLGSAEAAIRKAVDEAAQSSNTALEIRDRQVHGQANRLNLVVGYDSLEVLVDVVSGVPLTEPVKHRLLSLPYRDLADVSQELPVEAELEILAEKWFMLDDRDEPRDLYDLWFGITSKNADVLAVEKVYGARYGMRPFRNIRERVERLRGAWEIRLANQLRDLPAFDSVVGELEATIEEPS